MANAKIDDNRQHSLLGVTDDGNLTPTRLIVDPTTKRLKVSATISSGAITDLNGATASVQAFANDTNVTITTSGSTHTLGWTGVLSVARGGTGTSVAVRFADNESPGGAIDGTNTIFTVANTVSPTASIQFIVNGQVLFAGGTDYTLSGTTITVNTAPPTGSIIRAWYRY